MPNIMTRNLTEISLEFVEAWHVSNENNEKHCGKVLTVAQLLRVRVQTIEYQKLVYQNSTV